MTDGANPGPESGPGGRPGPREPREPRPWLERLGLGAVALLMSALFAFVAIAAGYGGEWILAALSAVGAVMTIAVGFITVVRG